MSKAPKSRKIANIETSKANTDSSEKYNGEARIVFKGFVPAHFYRTKKGWAGNALDSMWRYLQVIHYQNIFL